MTNYHSYVMTYIPHALTVVLHYIIFTAISILTVCNSMEWFVIAHDLLNNYNLGYNLPGSLA